MSTTKASSTNKTQQADLAKQLIAGTQKHLATVGQLTFAGGTFTPSQVEAELQTLVTLRTDADAAKAAAKAKVAAERAQLPALRAFMLAFEQLVKAQFGTQPDVLADFGLQPKKARKPMSPEQKAAAKAKRAATRAARGIIGTRKRAAVKGDVTGVTITPVTSAQPASATAAQPATQTATPPAPQTAAAPAPQTASSASNGGNATK
jgi:hypothetical protein